MRRSSCWGVQPIPSGKGENGDAQNGASVIDEFERIHLRLRFEELAALDHHVAGSNDVIKSP